MSSSRGYLEQRGAARVDVDDVDRKARAALHVYGSFTIDSDNINQPGIDAVAEHVAAAEPRAVIALVARIRELEGFIAAIIETPLGLDDDTVAEIRDLLDAGSTMEDSTMEDVR
jgi:hypothetical protein